MMSSGMRRDEIDELAADHALGLLEGERLVEAERLLAQDAAFAAAVAAWREPLAEIDATAAPAAAGPDLWRRIAASVAAPVPTDVPLAPARRRPRGGTWTSLPVWRAAAFAGMAAALVLAVALGTRPWREPSGPLYVAVLMTDANRPAAVVTIGRDGRAELVPLEPIAVPEGNALQVWTLWDRARGPLSIGLLDRARSAALDLAGAPAARADQLFEITLEPKQGSSTGRPTGPILMKGLTSAAL